MRKGEEMVREGKRRREGEKSQERGSSRELDNLTISVDFTFSG